MQQGGAAVTQIRRYAALGGAFFFPLSAMLSVFLLSFCFAGAAVAQDYTTGAVEGIVQDQSGTAVPGASVSITSDRGVRRSATTDNDGFFRAPRLPIGAYSVTVSATGYKDLPDQAVLVNIGDSAAYTFTLESEMPLMEEVVVTGTRRGTWDFSSTTTGISVDVVDLAERFPVQRNLTDIALFAPGTTLGDEAFGNLASFSGGSVAENAYYINGMNVTNFRTFTGSSVIPFEFYEQVEVKTGGYQAEFGRSIGGFTNSVTKSGSNEFKGGVYTVYAPEWMRRPRLDVQNSWNSFDEADNFELIGELSGPLIKDRLFFYAMYNMRDLQQVDVTSSRKYYDDDSDPFWGAKIDFVPFDAHRFEATLWSDETKVRTKTYSFNDAGLPREEISGDEQGRFIGESIDHSGGRNEIYRYTGVFTDWFTISAMYGKNRYERTALSSTDRNPVVYERLTNPTRSTVIGNWTQSVIRLGNDRREAWRVDADFYFDFVGDHHLRVGIDEENLTAIEYNRLSGGDYWRYHYCTQPTCFDGQLTEGEEYVRHLDYSQGGAFEVIQTAAYIQDSWAFSDNWRLNIGLRNETFDNRNAVGETFIKADRQLAPRIGLIWDPTGDGTHRVTAFYGRYFMPIAANTNIRLSGEETFIEEFLRHDGFAARTPGVDTPTGVDFANPLEVNVFADSYIPRLETLKDQTVDPLYSDEFILGYEHVFDTGIIFGVRGMYRELAVQIDDVSINHAIVDWAVDNGYTYEDVRWIINPEWTGPIYILTNPGTDMVVYTDVLTNDGSLVLIDLTAEQLEYPKTKREYKALELTFQRPWDGVWELNANYTYSTVRGNTEGLVKSDIGQADPGLTQDFDLVGVMLNADGPLPTENEHRLKVWGSWQPLDWLRLGGRFAIESPRKFGCLGVLPDNTFSDPDRQTWETIYGADYWFCNGEPTPRGSEMESDWLHQLDLSLTITPAFAENMPGQFQFRVDVFNVFDSDAVTDLIEQGEVYVGRGVGSPNQWYGKPSAYQVPRRVQLVAQWNF
jgi:hypothetical protein